MELQIVTPANGQQDTYAAFLCFPWTAFSHNTDDGKQTVSGKLAGAADTITAGCQLTIRAPVYHGLEVASRVTS